MDRLTEMLDSAFADHHQNVSVGLVGTFQGVHGTVGTHREVVLRSGQAEWLADTLVQAKADAEAVSVVAEHLGPIHETMAFLASVVASGEPLSPSVQESIDDARERFAEIHRVVKVEV